jgi:hypothetical protein
MEEVQYFQNLYNKGKSSKGVQLNISVAYENNTTNNIDEAKQNLKDLITTRVT